MHPTLRILNPLTPNIYPKLPPTYRFPTRRPHEVYRTSTVKQRALCAIVTYDQRLNNWDTWLFESKNVETKFGTVQQVDRESIEYEHATLQDAIAWCDAKVKQ